MLIRVPWLWFFFATIVVVARFLPGPVAGASYFLLAAYALTGRTQAIQALALSWLFSMLNPGLAPEPLFAAVGRYAVLGAAALSVLLRHGQSLLQEHFYMTRVVGATLVVGCGIVLHSFLFSPLKAVSVLKALAWTVSVVTLLSAWASLNESDRLQLERQIFGGLVALMLLSLPLLGYGPGYLVNGVGFQGVLSHPQAFGTMLGMLGAWLGSRVLGELRPAWSVVGLFALCIVLIVLSQARTAGLGLLLGLAVAAAVGRSMSHRTLREFLPGLRSRRVHLVVAIGLIIAVGAAPILTPRVASYISKSRDSPNSYVMSGDTPLDVFQAYDISRGSMIDEMWQDIQKRPWLGSGFGLPSDLTGLVVQREPLLGLPISASVEQGNWFVAVWLEIGIFGALAVSTWLWMLLRRAARHGGMRTLAVFLTALFMNFGEAVLFSPSGMGMLSLILITWAASRPRWQSEGARA